MGIDDSSMRDEVDASLDALAGGPGANRAAIGGSGEWASAFSVTELASVAIAAATAEVAALAGRDSAVDQRMASYWFGWSLEPIGWERAPTWDSVAGLYETSDGWIRLHTNAPHHRVAALEVLAADGNREAVAKAVQRWTGADLEAAITDANGCSAEMRSVEQWRVHVAGQSVAAEPLVAWTDGSQSTLRDSVGSNELRSDRPLAGLRVLDLTRVLAGPIATRFLAGWGAEVLRIDPPGWEEDNVVPEVTLGKRCARLDLTNPADLTVLEGLVASSDVFIHGYRPDALDRLGLSVERCQTLRPGLIDVSLDAYGWSGPWAGRRGFDSLVQMSSGIAHQGMLAARTDTPNPLPVQALDHGAGYLMAAAAVRGLRRRVITGQGAIAKCSLARTAKLLTDGQAGSYDAELAPLTTKDYNGDPEVTPWGLGSRLKPPASIEGIDMQWDRPSTALGSHSPVW